MRIKSIINKWNEFWKKLWNKSFFNARLVASIIVSNKKIENFLPVFGWIRSCASCIIRKYFIQFLVVKMVLNHFSRSYLPFVTQDTSFQIKKSKKIYLPWGGFDLAPAVFRPGRSTNTPPKHWKSSQFTPTISC